MRYTPKHAKQNRPQFSQWIMRIAAVIGCLTLISAYLLAGVYAKFSTTASGSDSARVAKFDVELLCTEEDLRYDGENWFEDTQIKEYSFRVTGNSEVAIGYSIKISFENPPPDYIKLWLDNGEKIGCDGEKTEFTFSGFSYAAAPFEKEHKLSLQVDYTDVDADYSAFTNFPVTISVTAEQID